MLYTSNVTSGATLNIAIVTKKQIMVANCGDCRAVLAKSKSIYFATSDHKPDDPLEKFRITARGGEVKQGRINGKLNVSSSGFKRRPKLSLFGR